MKYLTPGPVQIPKCVLEAYGRRPEFHKLDSFKEVFREVVEKLGKVVGGQPIILPGTGTLAVDAMVYNYVEPGDRVVALTYGEFGERLVESLECRGAEVFKLSPGVGRVPPPDVVEDFCRKVGRVSAIALVHNETGAGCTYRYLSRLRDVCDSLGAQLLVDSVSGIPAEPINTSVDVIATASQKAFLAPPGASILYLNSEPRARKMVPRSMDLRKFLNAIKDWETPYTPPINAVYGLDASLSYILRIGLSNYHELHKIRAEYLYSRLALEPVGEEGFRGRLDLKLLVCSEADENFTSNATSMGIGVYHAPCRVSSDYPIMNVNNAKDLIKWADIAWITDVEYLSALLIKQIRNIPVIAHVRSYALICPWWNVLYGFREPCLEKCSAWRFTRCKQGINLELAKIGLLSSVRVRLYWLLDFVKGPLDFFRWSRLMNGVAESIDGFIAVSKALWEIHVRHLLSLSSKPFSIVYNPVTEPLKHVKSDPHEPYGDYVLYASGSNPDKGPHLLLEAWREVSREFRDLKLYMVGCKGSWVERLAKRMSLNNVILFGKLPSDEYYRLMYRARAVVMPSIWPEPFGRIPVEANRLGVPAVVSSAGGLPETIVNGVTGYIFIADDADDLAKKVMKVLERDFNREEIIRHSYEKINPQREVERLIKFFESVVNYERRV